MKYVLELEIVKKEQFSMEVNARGPFRSNAKRIPLPPHLPWTFPHLCITHEECGQKLQNKIKGFLYISITARPQKSYESDLPVTGRRIQSARQVIQKDPNDTTN
jgi:hypothetical protein